MIKLLMRWPWGGGQAGAPAGPGARHAGAESFFRSGGSDLHKDALYSARQRHHSPYVLLQGAFLKGKLLTAINSELPGMIRGKITEDVYDTATGAHLLVPMGSFVVGRYSSEVNSGQRRVQIAWTRLNFPDGSFMDLGSMSGGDETGASGVRDKLNRHLGRRIGMGILLSTLTISHEVMAPANQQGFGSAVHRGAGDAIVSLGTESIRDEMNIPPTVEIRQGARFTIHVNRDLVFSESYRRLVP